MTLRPSRVLAICASLAFLPFAAWAQCDPDEIALAADRDNTLYEDMAGGLSNGAGDYLFSGASGVNGLRRALVHFDVAGAVPAGSIVTSATLWLNMSMSIAGPQDVSLHAVSAGWGEGTSDAPGAEGGGAPSTAGDATWIHTFYDTSFWAVAGGDFAALPSATAPVDGVGLYDWGSTPGTVADVQSWLDDPAGNFGWILIGNETATMTAKRFDSRDNVGAGALPPVLCVSAAPPLIEVPTLSPGALLLLTLALAAVAVRRLV